MVRKTRRRSRTDGAKGAEKTWTGAHPQLGGEKTFAPKTCVEKSIESW